MVCFSFQEMTPNDYTELVLGQRCEHKTGGRSTHSPADQELTFTFMPREIFHRTIIESLRHLFVAAPLAGR